MITLGVELSNIKTQRASVIPYTIRDGVMYYLLGVHSETGDITDFGGGVKKSENSLYSAAREWKEETKGVFGSDLYNINNMLLNVAVYDKNMALLFVPINNKWIDTANFTFQSITPLKKDNQEISSLRWYTHTQFMNLLKHRSRLWDRIRRFYVKEFNQDMFKLLNACFCYHSRHTA